MARSIAMVLFDGLEELDFVGPWEVFSYLAAIQPETCRVFSVSERGGEVTCARDCVIADHSFDDAPPADIILVPGGMGTHRGR
ncbi:MAG: DJ-1/PfpI family protein [Dehalococcoidia bacterium]